MALGKEDGIVVAVVGAKAPLVVTEGLGSTIMVVGMKGAEVETLEPVLVTPDVVEIGSPLVEVGGTSVVPFREVVVLLIGGCGGRELGGGGGSVVLIVEVGGSGVLLGPAVVVELIDELGGNDSVGVLTGAEPVPVPLVMMPLVMVLPGASVELVVVT
jgi:hypothetical protein